MNNSHHVAGTSVAVAVDSDGPLVGILLCGEPGTGKSSIALTLIEACPWRRTRLIADDLVLLTTKKEGLFASAPESIEGLIEIRGFGPSPIEFVRCIKLYTVFDLNLEHHRLPDPEGFMYGEYCLSLWPLTYEYGVEHRIRLILRAILSGQTP